MWLLSFPFSRLTLQRPWVSLRDPGQWGKQFSPVVSWAAQMESSYLQALKGARSTSCAQWTKWWALRSLSSSIICSLTKLSPKVGLSQHPGHLPRMQVLPAISLDHVLTSEVPTDDAWGKSSGKKLHVQKPWLVSHMVVTGRYTRSSSWSLIDLLLQRPARQRHGLKCLGSNPSSAVH